MQQLEAAFEEKLRVLDPPRPFALAVSGGPDSMALMRLAAPVGPVVFTVDHGLRAGSADEAAKVGAWARGLGLRHEVLVWTGPKPAAGIQEAARRARYQLLANACARAGAASLLTGHTLDDQIETVAMRLGRGSGALGLAGMPSQSLLGDSLRLVRPLLATRKADLIGWLETIGQSFLCDPSNADPRFDRARLRAGEGPAVAVDDIVRAQRSRAGIEQAALRFLTGAAVYLGAGGVAVEELADLPDAVLDAVLTALLRRVGGADHPGTRAERGRIAAALRAGGVFRARTLGGTLIRPPVSRDGPLARGRLVFVPERGGNPRFSAYWLPMGQFVQMAADGSWLAAQTLPFETTDA